jgi:DNA-binding transcriptional ArsR family regulator
MDAYRVANATQVIGGRARASMLVALVTTDGLPARALARDANVSPQAASRHLSQLVGAGLVTCERRGRHRYYRLRDARVAHAIESLAALAPPAHAEPPAPAPPADPLHAARSCYDHLGGTLAVALTDALVANGWLTAKGADYEPTGVGARVFRQVGVSVIALRVRRRAFARGCPDWSERRHLGGALGAALKRAFVERGWLREDAGSRAVSVTAEGREGLARTFGVRL